MWLGQQVSNLVVYQIKSARLFTGHSVLQNYRDETYMCGIFTKLHNYFGLQTRLSINGVEDTEYLKECEVLCIWMVRVDYGEL